MLEWLELPLYFYLLGVTFFFENFYLNFFGNVFVVYIFPWIWNQKKMLVGVEGG